MIEIREMKVEDYENIKESIQDDFDEFWSASTLKSELENNNSKYIVAAKNNTVLGFAGINYSIFEADITNIVVKKSERNNGIGTMLLDKLIKIAQELQLSKISLEVNENNIAAINLYKLFDFEQVGFRKNYYNGKENALIMIKSL